jgi:hypothetical protein
MQVGTTSEEQLQPSSNSSSKKIITQRHSWVLGFIPGSSHKLYILVNSLQ